MHGFDFEVVLGGLLVQGMAGSSGSTDLMPHRLRLTWQAGAGLTYCHPASSSALRAPLHLEVLLPDMPPCCQPIPAA